MKKDKSNYIKEDNKRQPIIAGKLIGSTMGFVIGHYLSSKNRILGATIGMIAGALIGHVIDTIIA